jgi:L-asparaginase II
VWRGALIESRHRVHVAVVDAGGVLRAAAGAASIACYARSAVKPFQALPLVEDGVAARFGFTAADLAVCCASHSGEPTHVRTVRGMLGRIGVEEEALACGPHEPFHDESARALRRAGQAPAPVHNNCSGKHAGMLGLARLHGWPLAGYHTSEHPVQRRMLTEISRWTEIPVDDIGLAVDGCGATTFALELSAMAGAFARFARAARTADGGPREVVHAMVRWPENVAGSGRLCTSLMRVAEGRIFAKVGAEGVYCAGIPGAELGVAVKVDDGSTRASEPALLAVLRTLGLLSDDEMASLAHFAEPDILNTRGERVGAVRATVRLEAGRD